MSDDLDRARRVVEDSKRADERASFLTVRRRLGKRAEPRITDPLTHPREAVNLTVAAEFLKMDRRALNYFIDSGRIAIVWRGRQRKVRVTDLVAFNAEQNRHTG
jgi:hypothetical protein